MKASKSDLIALMALMDIEYTEQTKGWTYMLSHKGMHIGYWGLWLDGTNSTLEGWAKRFRVEIEYAKAREHFYTRSVPS